ncbi:inorganic phosphate transporter [Blattabacterium cuenoti]|uniref:inorganic phosphate transporter n=1 Tax=Blattabacterium cuenoti TaxID=1653831 RepID=UPI00163C3EED|nr:inorganic phosphate transporter [Blattabacterium cuenoti]
MKSFYPSVIILIFILSIFDLIVGLINDAVNFLNSAIGSKVSSRTVIMIFASIGIILGSFLSSGMMEIARKGVFDPSKFCFSDVIFIFLSVMISDIILLDIFNTLGLPTSTTVSMVFCLLGGSFSIAIIKILLNKESFYHINQYIKFNKTINISLGIFLSIIISFISGSFIHYFIRFLFGFNYEKKKLRYTEVIWATISLSSMTYFLIIKGLYSSIKGVDINTNGFITQISLYIQQLTNWIHQNFFIFLLLLLLTWLIVAIIFIFFRYNIFKFVVLYGTFSLAMAFSGNDLVNFIGVPIAGVQSYNIWIKEGNQNPEKFNMKSLSGNKVKVDPSILIFSGLIMILTLWFSKKTKNISSTEINLSRQYEGPEKFLSNSLSRWIVRFFIHFGYIFKKLFPKIIYERIEKNFRHNKIEIEKNAAFDLIRASANLTISSILLSIATIKKLPLSTTFVTFMVSMGTSLSDRAWDRESAVYRVSGVLNVIRGWILTGIIAFAISGVVSSFLYFFKIWAILFLVILIIFISYKNYKKYKLQEKKFEEYNILLNISEKNLLSKIHNIIKHNIEFSKEIYTDSVNGIIQEDLKLLRNGKNNLLKLKENYSGIENSLISVIKKLNKNNFVMGIFYFHMYGIIKNIIKSLDVITNYTLLHVINCHKPLKYKQKKNLFFIENKIVKCFNLINKLNKNNYNHNNYKYVKLLIEKIHYDIIKKIRNQINQQVIGITRNDYGTKNTFLMLNIILESKKISELIKDIIFLYYDIFSNSKNLR